MGGSEIAKIIPYDMQIIELLSKSVRFQIKLRLLSFIHTAVINDYSYIYSKNKLFVNHFLY